MDVTKKTKKINKMPLVDHWNDSFLDPTSVNCDEQLENSYCCNLKLRQKSLKVLTDYNLISAFKSHNLSDCSRLRCKSEEKKMYSVNTTYQSSSESLDYGEIFYEVSNEFNCSYAYFKSDHDISQICTCPKDTSKYKRYSEINDIKQSNGSSIHQTTCCSSATNSSSCSCSSTSEVHSNVPPPMALINVKRLSIPTSLSYPVYNDSPKLPSIEIPVIYLDATKDETFCLIKNASARDSGLSSHSSSSICYAAIGATAFVNPPPIPPHAPHSKAAVAASAVIECDKECNKTATNVSSTRTKSKTQTLKTRPNHVNGKQLVVSPEIRPLDCNHHSYRTSSKYIQQRSTPLDSPNDPPPHHSIPDLNEASSSTPSPDFCLACTLNWQFYLAQPPYFDQLGRVDEDAAVRRTNFVQYVVRAASSTEDKCPTCRQHLYNVGIHHFNRNPLKGLQFLEKHNILNLSHPDNVVQFILTNSNLCKSKIGALLGLPATSTLDTASITQKLLESLDFTGIEVDEALRMVVHHFGMPIESQEIDRFIQCLSQHYHSIRWPVDSQTTASNNSQSPISVDQLYLVFYAILLLQTSLHNANAAKSSLGKQTVGQFIKIVRDILSTSTSSIKHEFSNYNLTAIFHRIKSHPLKPGPDATESVSRLAQSLLWTSSQTNQETGLDLVLPHRRLVSYCTVLHIIPTRTKDKKDQTYLRHLFVFNDLLLIAKDLRPSKLPFKSMWSSNLTDKQVEVLFAQAPKMTFRPPFESRTDDACIATRCIGVTPFGLRRRARSEHEGTRMRLLSIKMIPLLGCQIRPFQTKVYQYGLELWSPPYSDCQSSPISSDGDIGVFDSFKLKPAATLAAITKLDFNRLVKDLFESLRQTTHVHLGCS